MNRAGALLGQLVSGPVIPYRNTVATAEILCVQAGRIGNTAAVDAELGAVDVIEGIGAVVVVGVERLARGSAPQLRLLFRLFSLGAGEQSAGGNARQRKPV